LNNTTWIGLSHQQMSMSKDFYIPHSKYCDCKKCTEDADNE